MTWSVFDGIDPDYRDELFRFARLTVPTGEAVLEAIELADDSTWYVQHALLNGYTPTTIEANWLIDYVDEDLYMAILMRSTGTFSAEDALVISDCYLEEERAKTFLRQCKAQGTQFSDDQIQEIQDLFGDQAFTFEMADVPMPQSMYPGGEKKIQTLGDLAEERARQRAANAQGQNEHLGILGTIGLFAAGKMAADALTGHNEKPPTGDGYSLGGPREFKDFNNAWGSNNDHNWEADGDMKWDSYNGM